MSCWGCPAMLEGVRLRDKKRKAERDDQHRRQQEKKKKATTRKVEFPTNPNQKRSKLLVFAVTFFT